MSKCQISWAYSVCSPQKNSGQVGYWITSQPPEMSLQIAKTCNVTSNNKVKYFSWTGSWTSASKLLIFTVMSKCVKVQRVGELFMTHKSCLRIMWSAFPQISPHLFCPTVFSLYALYPLNHTNTSHVQACLLRLAHRELLRRQDVKKRLLLLQ